MAEKQGRGSAGQEPDDGAMVGKLETMLESHWNGDFVHHWPRDLHREQALGTMNVKRGLRLAAKARWLLGALIGSSVAPVLLW